LKMSSVLLNVRHDKAIKKVDELVREEEFGAVSIVDIVYNNQGQTVKTYALDIDQATWQRL